MTDFALLLSQAEALTEGIPYLWANLANLSALLYGSLEDINWVGFYEVRDDGLVLGPFQGRPACVLLPLDRGVCAACVRENKLLNVPDVHAFSGHIACDSASKSELVLPLRGSSGRASFVLDIDSPVVNRFQKADEEGLAALKEIIEKDLPLWQEHT